MVQNILLKILLSPISLIYGLSISVRNLLYKVGLLKAFHFSVPVINVGNLTIGGAGKSPHIEFLMNWLSEYMLIATLSRGYKRKTKGFLWVNPNQTAIQFGDEPLQLKRKFPSALVAVAEDRALAIPKIISQFPGTKAILLDDAYQHLSVHPSFNILLTEYSNLYSKDFLLPSGRLREWRSAAKRADMVIVTKCPSDLTLDEAKGVESSLSLSKEQNILFSEYIYEQAYSLYNPAAKVDIRKEDHIILVSAIAKTDYLLQHLHEKTDNLRSIEFEDHHLFTNYDVAQMKRVYEHLPPGRKYILTTEKDAMRLELHRDFLHESKIPVFILPAKVSFLFNQEGRFKEYLINHLLEFKS